MRSIGEYIRSDREWEWLRRAFLLRAHINMRDANRTWDDLHEDFCLHCIETRPIPFTVVPRKP